MIHRIIGTSVLAPFRKNHEYRLALDEAAALGFNLVRSFCGPLPWCGQEASYVYGVLPHFLQDCADRGLNAYLSYCTEAGTGYDLDQHVDAIEDITEAFPAVVLREAGGNEPWHPSQGGRLTPSRCRDLSLRVPFPSSYGAAEDDESLEYAGGDFTAIHLDRGRDKWNMVRRVREMLAVSEATGKPALNQEPIGADEVSQPGKREADPAIFYTMGALNRLFGVGGVFHSEDGLWARPLGPNQRRCAEAFVRGSRVWPTDADRLQYLNVGHAGSPIVSATFNEGDLSKPGCTRSYSGIVGDRGYNVTLGISDMAQPGAVIGNGWRWGAEIGREPGVLVLEVLR